MKYPIIFLGLLLSLSILGCQEIHQENKTTEIQNGYDAEAALKYGADEYGMKKYILAFLKTGPNRDLSKEDAQKLQMEHLKNITKMAEEGKLVVAGPFFGEGDMRGIYIFNVESLEEARTLTESDPAIKAGSLVMELKEWYCSAALMAVNDIHNTLTKKSITE